MSNMTSRTLLALLLLCSPLLGSCVTCGFGEVYEAASPKPDKCFECPLIDGSVEHGKSNIDGVGKSYTDFFCKYTTTEEKKITYPGKDDTKRLQQWIIPERVPAYCYYNEQGSLIHKDSFPYPNYAKCAKQLTPIPNCTPEQFVKYDGNYLRCCGEGCELAAPGTCYTCPNIGGDFVDVDVRDPSRIECTYHGREGSLYRAVTRCYYSPTNGNAVSGYRNEAPCSMTESKQAAIAKTCRNRTPTCPENCPDYNNCWSCPSITGRETIDLTLRNTGDFQCKYTDQTGKFICTWEKATGKQKIPLGRAGPIDSRCPKTPVCNLSKA